MALSQGSLTTIEAFKTHLAIPQDNTDNDAIFESLIESVSQAVENYTGRVFVNKKIEEEPHEGDGKLLQLDHYPVFSLEKVIVDGIETDLSSVSMDKNSGILERYRGFGAAALVTYNAGYAQLSADVPKDIQLAVHLWAESVYKRPDDSIKSESLGDYSITYTDAPQYMPQSVAGILENYKARYV